MTSSLLVITLFSHPPLEGNRYPGGPQALCRAHSFSHTSFPSRNFINADLIAQGVSPFRPEAVALRAGRLMLEEIKLAAKRRESFGFETTLASRGHVSLVSRVKKSGYEVHFFFLWIPAVELALTRVKTRVMEGGHDVPETVVRRRFDRSIRNFFLLYRSLGDSWTASRQLRRHAYCHCL